MLSLRGNRLYRNPKGGQMSVRKYCQKCHTVKFFIFSQRLGIIEMDELRGVQFSRLTCQQCGGQGVYQVSEEEVAELYADMARREKKNKEEIPY
jgi:RNase P subunit RPR2